ncbi:MAG: hypothetical protein V7744_06185 [Pseudomonadales bacterium]
MNTQKVVIALSISLIFSMQAHANSIKKLDIEALQGFGEAPSIKVYSSKGEKWDRIDKTHASTIKVRLNAKCKYEGKGNKAYKGELQIPGFTTVGDTEPANFLIPHSSESSRVVRYNNGEDQPVSPLQVCANELEKRLSQDAKLTKYHVMAKGFTVNYPAAIYVKYRMYCRATGWGRTDLGSDSAQVNAKIQCQKSDLAAAKIPPKPKPIPKRAVMLSLVKGTSFVAAPKEHKGKCPVSVEFKGKITTNYKGNVIYRYVSHDGRKSPELTAKFDKAGSQKTRKWFRTISEPDVTQQLSAGGTPSQWDVQGWYRLEILNPKGIKSVTTKYRVDCQAPKTVPMRAVKAPQ